jgi:hypothetical protein
MNNLDIYNKVRVVPKEAQKTISAGRIKGMTDINPMWRIQTLTEIFGVCGFGWKYTITNQRIIDGADNTKCAFVDIDLFVKVDGEWSDAIPGTGGSSYIASESKGLYTSDECFKMALTDALSVACKALGIGADVYWEGGRTKYNNAPKEDTPTQPYANATPKLPTARERLIARLKDMGKDVNAYAKEKGLSNKTTAEEFERLLKELG